MLRPYHVDDFEAFASYFASSRSIYTDGPVSRVAAWDLFTAGAGRWVIAGHGAWTIQRQSDGVAMGLVARPEEAAQQAPAAEAAGSRLGSDHDPVVAFESTDDPGL